MAIEGTCLDEAVGKVAACVCFLVTNGYLTWSEAPYLFEEIEEIQAHRLKD